MEKHPPLSFILEYLVRDVLDFQRSEEGAQLRSLMSPLGFMKEFCTVRLGTRRRAGHSTAIINCLSTLSGSVVAVPLLAQKRWYMEHGVRERDIFLIDGKTGLKNAAFGIVFVDCSNYVPQKAKDAISDEIADCGVVTGSCLAFVE